MLLKSLMFKMKESILIIIKNHDRRNNSVFKHGIIPSIKLLGANWILENSDKNLY